MGLLASLFGFHDSLTRLARKSDPQAFLASLIESHVVVLSGPSEPQLDPATTTDEELIAGIGASLKQLAEKTEFLPFIYEDSGRRVLPFFSTQKLAERFVVSYISRVQRVMAFDALTIRGHVLGSLRDAADRYVLNAETEHSCDCTDHLGVLFQAMREV